MQSHSSTEKKQRTPLPLPWGMGSMSFRGSVWWLTYRDAAGKIHYDNSGTDDAKEAQRIMAVRALPRAKAMVAKLERIIHAEARQSHGAAGGSPAKPGRAGGDRRKTPSNPRPRRSPRPEQGGQN
jgi:hypothetical protein